MSKSSTSYIYKDVKYNILENHQSHLKHNNLKKDATRKDFIPASNHFDIRLTIFKVRQNVLQQNNSIKKYR